MFGGVAMERLTRWCDRSQGTGQMTVRPVAYALRAIFRDIIFLYSPFWLNAALTPSTKDALAISSLVTVWLVDWDVVACSAVCGWMFAVRTQGHAVTGSEKEALDAILAVLLATLTTIVRYAIRRIRGIGTPLVFGP
jgi:hypothetical protein